MSILFRRLTKSKPLRIVNLIGLSIVFACLLLSYGYVKKELSYDRFHANADRMYRLTLQYNDEKIDGRIWNYFDYFDPIIKQIPEIEDILALGVGQTGVLTFKGEQQVVHDLYFVDPDFFHFFSFNLLQGDKDKVFEKKQSVALSKSFARQLFGTESPIGKEIQLSGRKFSESALNVTGVFQDFPETSHFHTDILIRNTNDEDNPGWPYVYILLKEKTDFKALEQHLTQKLQERDNESKTTAYLTPITDIHLHSHLQRELEENGNINFIYLIIGANILLFIIVLFNLWLNTRSIFSSNQKYYQLLRLNGASSFTVVRDEAFFAMLLGLVSMLAGGLLVYFVPLQLPVLSAIISIPEIILISAAFLLFIILISILSVLTKMSSTLFFNTENDLKPLYNSSFTIKYMLLAQYAIVMFTVIMAFGINKQMALVRNSQLAGKASNIMILKEQPYEVMEHYDMLKEELLKYPEIQAVTTTMQLPGEAIRDGLLVGVEGEEKEEMKSLNVLVVGDDFFSFFNIKPIAGNLLKPLENRTMSDEFTWLNTKFGPEQRATPGDGITEEYVLNKEALAILGFQTPEDAVGKLLELSHQGLGYIPRGKVVGVVDNFTYTNVYEKHIPLIVMSRKMFQHCLVVRLDPNHTDQAVAIYKKVWKDINPGFPAEYTFLQDVYGKVYANELNAERLTNIFSLLCFLIADLGLIIFMAFIIKRRTKEIGIRKVSGATAEEIIWMLNSNFIPWIGLAFTIAIPAAYLAMRQWLKNFAYQTSLDWWMFALAGVSVLILSVASVSWQSWRASVTNPVDAIKNE